MSSIANFDQATMMVTDFDFFEVTMNRYQEQLKQSLMDKRADQDSEQPNKEELICEIYYDVSQMEQDFKKTLEITSQMMKVSRDLFDKNADLSQAFDELNSEVQQLRDEREA